MTEETTRYAAHHDEVSGTVEVRKVAEDAPLADYQLELSEDEVSEHVYLDRWNTRRPKRFSQRDQSYPPLMALLARADEAGKIRL